MAEHSQGSGRGRPGEVLIIVCAGVVLASLDLFIVNVALPDIARDLDSRSLARPLLGAQRLRDRLRRAARAVRPPRRAAPARVRLPARRRRVHRSPRPPAAPPTSLTMLVALPGRAGGGRGAAHADLPQPRARHHRARAPRTVRSAPGRPSAAWRPRSGPVVGGLLVAAQLALGIPRQRAGRRCSRWSSAGGGCRGSRVTRSARPTRSARSLVTAGVAALTLAPGQGRRLGLGLAPRRSARSRRPSSCWRRSPCTAPHARNPLIDAALFRVRSVHRLLASSRSSSRSRSGRCCSRSGALVPGRCGAGRRSRPASRSHRGRSWSRSSRSWLGGRLIARFGPGRGDRRRARSCSPPAPSGGRSRSASAPTTSAACSAASCSPGSASG